MEVYTNIERMEPYLLARDWDGLERSFEAVCREKAGEAQASRISRVDLTGYEAALRDGLRGAMIAARVVGAKAIYFEYDLDNRWDSTFFACQGYAPRSAGDDDWACEWAADITGPSLEEFGKIYLENDFARNDTAIGSTVYLVARTVAAFGRAAEGLDIGNVALCIGFHDQDPITRLRDQL